MKYTNTTGNKLQIAFLLLIEQAPWHHRLCSIPCFIICALNSGWNYRCQYYLNHWMYALHLSFYIIARGQKGEIQQKKGERFEWRVR